jgi:hypothetical protein
MHLYFIVDLNIVAVICLSVLHAKVDHSNLTIGAVFKSTTMAASGCDNIPKKKPTKWKTLHVLSSLTISDEVLIVKIME